MSEIEINSVVKSLTFIKKDKSGNIEIERVTSDTCHGRGSKGMKPLERMVRRVVKSEIAAASVYIERHNRSNRSEKDGWIKDFGKNIGKAMKSARDADKEHKLTVVR